MELGAAIEGPGAGLGTRSCLVLPASSWFPDIQRVSALSGLVSQSTFTELAAVVDEETVVTCCVPWKEGGSEHTPTTHVGSERVRRGRRAVADPSRRWG